MKILLISMLLLAQYSTEEEALVDLDQRCLAMSGWPLKSITNFYQCYTQDGRLIFEERIDPLYRIA